MNRLARTALVAACLLLPGGCTYWKPAVPAPRAALSAEQSRVRITLRDSTQVTLSRAVLFRDSISGFANGRRTAVALSDIAYVQYRQPGYVQTQGVTGALVVVGLMLGVAAALALLYPDE